jgi:transketolase
MRILGFAGFAPTGSSEFLLDHAGLDALGIRDAALSIVRDPRRGAGSQGVGDA